MKVVCMGDCGIDHYLPDHTLRVGGITANVARHARDEFAAADENEIVIVSCLGDDDAADQVRNTLQRADMECLWETRAGTTPVQYIDVQPDGERRFVRYEAGVLADFHFSESQREAIRSSDLLVAPMFVQIRGLFERLMAITTQGLVAIDFADFLQHPDFELLERYAERLHIGFFGLAADRHDHIERLAEVARRHDKLFVVTLGSAGSLALHGTARYSCPVQPIVKVVDTTGAGDAYAAGFLVSYCRGEAVQAAMRNGTRLASRVVARSGSYPG